MVPLVIVMNIKKIPKLEFLNTKFIMSAKSYIRTITRIQHHIVPSIEREGISGISAYGNFQVEIYTLFRFRNHEGVDSDLNMFLVSSYLRSI